ncbi:hypothetical protein ACFX2I_008926 [Malus domestica]
MEWTTVQAWTQEMKQLRSQPYTVESITLLLAMVSTMVAIYVADRLWQNAADRVYLIQKLDKRNGKNISGCGVLGLPTVKSLNSSCGMFGLICLFGTQAAVEPSMCDGLTVDQIIASEWSILDEDESDWKSHAAAIAQSIHLIKKRLQWKKLLIRLDMLSMEVNKPDLWNDPVHAGKICRKHGSLLGKMKEVQAFERELLEHVDMVKLAREENDAELESVGFQYFS